MVIKVPANVSLNSGENNEIKDLTKSISNSGRKELVLLLPFNISTIESDTTLSTQDRLKRDGFLNMTLDFYSGALMAIDSVKRLGLNFNVKIIDSKETKSSSAISSIIRSNNLENADAVIGPFYPQYVEQTAELLNASNVPVISPLRETSKSYSNLFQSMPPGDLVKNTMFDFIRAKNGNMIALIDKKKLASKQYIEVSHRDVFIAPLNENGTVIADSITPRLVSNKTNYFILETASTGMIFSALSQCNTARTNGFNVELVVLDINSTFESDEVFQKIVKQKIIFPSLTKYQETPESIRFASNYKKIKTVVGSKVKMMAMVKAFGYGSGSIEVARILQFHHVDYLSVAYADEGVDLRQAGIHVPIMVMNVDETTFDTLVKSCLFLVAFAYLAKQVVVLNNHEIAFLGMFGHFNVLTLSKIRRLAFSFGKCC